MRLSCLLLGCFFSFYIFAQPSEKTYGNIKEAQGHAIKAPRSMIGVDADHSVGVSVDGEAIGERCLSPENTLRDAGTSLSLDFTEPKPLLPAGGDTIFIQKGKTCFKYSCIDRSVPYCVIKVLEKHVKKAAMQLVEGPVRIKVTSSNAKGLEHYTDIDSSLALEEPFEAIGCKGNNKYHTGSLAITEFKKIVGDSMRVNLNCSKLGASKSKK